MSQVVVLAYTQPDYHGPNNLVLRIVVPNSFIGSTGTLIQGNNTSFYKEIPCTVSGTTVTVPQFIIESTTDALNLADRQTAGYSAFFYTNKGKFVSLFENFQFFKVPPVPNPTTWNQIALYTTPLPPLPIDLSSFYTKDQINALIGMSSGGGGVPASRRIDTAGGLAGGGDLTTNRTHSIADLSPNPAGTYSNLSATINAKGQVTHAANGIATAPVTSVFGRTGAITAQPNDYPIFTNPNRGMAPPTGAPSGKFLRDDATWATPAAGAADLPGEFTLEQFGGAADGGTDNHPATVALTNYLRANGIAGGTVRLQRGNYVFSDNWLVKHELRIIGAGSWYSTPATQLNFAPRTTGIIADDAKGGVGGDFDPGSAGLILENLACFGSSSGFDGTCNVNGTTVTRVSGPAFTSLHLTECMISLQDAGTGGIFDYIIAAVTDADHLELSGDYMLANSAGSGVIGRVTDYEFDPNCVGGTIQMVNEGAFGAVFTIDSWADIGNIHVTPDLGFGGQFHSLKSGYAGVRSGVNYRINNRHGLEVRARVYVTNCLFAGFPGMGICADAGRPTGSAFPVNLDLSYFAHCRLVSNHGHGFFTIGNDSQVDQINLLDSSENHGWGFKEASFLGNTYISCHTEGNRLGSYYAGNTGLCHCVFMGCYAEDNQVGILGAYGVTFIGGTLNNVHPFNVAQSIGSVVTGNFTFNKVFIGVGADKGLYSSLQLGAVSGTQRNMISDQGTYMLVGQFGYPLAIGSNILELYGSSGIVANNIFFPVAGVQAASGAADPTTSDISAGTWTVWKNTSSGVAKVWMNDGGVMKSVTLS